MAASVAQFDVPARLAFRGWLALAVVTVCTNDIADDLALPDRTVMPGPDARDAPDRASLP